MSKLGRQLQAATANFNADASEKLAEIRLIKDQQRGKKASKKAGDA